MNSALLLLLASVALLIGPFCALFSARSHAVRELVDGFALVVITGICLLVVLPHVVTEIGFIGLPLAVAGAALPSLAHRLERGPGASLIVVTFALFAHVLLDGGILSMQSESTVLGWAVVAHRLPAGFAIVLAAQGTRQPVRVAWAIAFSMVLATLIGYVSGPALISLLPHEGVAGLEALVAGVLLHVVFVPHKAANAGHDDHGPAHPDHEHHDHEHHDHEHHGHGHNPMYPHHNQTDAPPLRSIQAGHRWATAGALFGFVTIGGLLHGHGDAEDSVSAVVQTLGVLLLESAPALLLGYALAGVVPFLLTPARASALGTGGTIAQSIRGVGFGLPLPVCSCGVLPLYESLVRRGAPPVAALAFFVATPELGLDAVLLSVPLLGSSLTIARVVAAFVVAVLVALLVGRQAKARWPSENDEKATTGHESWRTRIRAGVRFGFVEVFDHTMPWIALGLVVAAVAEPLLSHGAIAKIPEALQVPLAALVGVPMYVCASGATPVAALAIHKGLSSGAAITFLIAGPATNVTTFGVLARLHGRHVALLFGLSVTTLAMVVGWVVDGLDIPAAPILDTHANVHSHGSWFSWLCVAGLALLATASLFRQGPRGMLRQLLEPIHVH